jgi:glycosyltransferase involved in cell wall biosynthesis
VRVAAEMTVPVLYVSYDGVLDPLGSSQVVPYVAGLAGHGFSPTLISFEKPERWSQVEVGSETRRGLAARGVRWVPLHYHRRPRLAATALDVIAGRRAIAREWARSSPRIVHCRGDVAGLMARWAHLPSTCRFLYDVRGFFSDERVETGSWRRGSLLDRAVRRAEAANLDRADGAVVLTQHAARIIRERRPSLPALRVVPTCVDVSAFRPRAVDRTPEFGLAYVGSVGTWYMADAMVSFARLAAGAGARRALFLTPEPREIARRGATADWAEVKTVPPRAVAEWLPRATATFFFIKPVASKRASCPTKFAEGLASGLPVVCNRGIGDLDDIVEREGVGVLIDELSEPAYLDALRRLEDLLRDPGLSARCRRLAQTRYSLRLGVGAYRELYDELLASGAVPSPAPELERIP